MFSHSSKQETLRPNKEKASFLKPGLYERFIEKGKPQKSRRCQIRAASVTPLCQVTLSYGIGHELKEKENRNQVSPSIETGLKLLFFYGLEYVSSF